MAITSTKKINMSIYFEILMVGLQALYVFNTYIKFCTNRMLFTIRWIIFIFYA